MKTNKDNILKLYIEDILREQEELANQLYEDSISIDTMIGSYFNSKIWKGIENRQPYFMTKNWYDYYTEIDFVKNNNASNKYEKWEYSWAITFYTQLYLLLNQPMNTILKNYNINYIMENINLLHDMDQELAAQKLISINENIIFFHGDSFDQYKYFSNWYPNVFYSDSGVRYTSVEQYMMSHKALLFDDIEIANEIMKTNDVSKIKNLGRKVRNFNEEIWDRNKENIVYKGLKYKFTQDKTLKDKLLSTGDAELVECAAKDTVWAIGIGLRDKRRFNRDNWRGQNLLGKNLMKVREDIR